MIVFSLLPGCSLRGTPQAAGLAVKIDSPASGMLVAREEEIAGQLMDTAQAPRPLQPVFSTVQRWQANVPGESLIEVRAYDEKGTASPPDSIVIRVNSEEAELRPPPTTPDGASIIIPTVTPLPTVALPTARPTALLCERNSKFVEDITVPDNSAFTAGAAFVKTWRVRNSGTCPWTDGYELAFVEGEQMDGPDATSAPGAEPQEETDISVALIAPGKPGTYRGDWRLRAPDGEIFGGKLYLQITVRAPTATQEPTAIAGPTATPAVTVTVTTTPITAD
jgi:hypothetical protein